MNITDPIRQAARRQPDALAYTGVPNRIEVTYAEFDRLIDGLAARALDAGLRPGQTVIVDLRDEIAHLVVSYGLMRIGICAAPPTLAERFAIARIAASSDAGSSVRNIVIDEQWFAVDAPPSPAPMHAAGDATAVIIGTSGTTGVRRHFPLTHDVLMRRVAIARELMPLPPEPRVMVRVGLWTSFAFLVTLRAFHDGALAAFPRFGEGMSAVAVRRINVLFMPPATCAAFMQATPEHVRFPTLERVYLAGSIAPSALIREAHRRLCLDVRTLYGATEVGPIACGVRDALDDSATTIGPVSRDVEVQCVDDDDAPCAPGVEGIIRVRRNAGGGGYLDADDTAQAGFSGDWFYPGDIGSLSADRVLTIMGRASDVVNIGGDKRSLHVIEEAVRAQDEKALDVAAFVVPGALGVPQLHVAVVAGEGLDVDALAARCLDNQVVPLRTRFVQVAALPRNDSGKVMRDELAAAHRTSA